MQKRILLMLAGLFPGGTYALAAELGDASVSESALFANVQYLAGHELVSSGLVLDETSSGAHVLESRLTSITHKGLDFLAEDGGLSAIFGTVTVRLHGDDLRALVAARISGSDALATAEKRKALDALRELPGESIKHVFLKVLDLGWDQAPGAIGVIGKLLGL
ncbi:MAG: hypothetical protein Q7K57_08820 [Burkholderiaceae bacterium]|nr:hypothetical protein [Burkholderiaceae bacterium]